MAARMSNPPNLLLKLSTIVACGLFSCCLSSSACADDAESADLQGILPDYIPNGLTPADFNQLGNNWADWAQETGRLVGDFYVSDDDSIRGRRETLKRLRVKLITMEEVLDDPQYLSIYGPLADLYSRLSIRVRIYEALLDTLDRAGSDEVRQQVADLGSKLLAAMESYSSEPTTENMEAIRHTFDDIRRLAPEASAPLTTAMRHEYLNYNLRIVADESLLQEVIHDTRMESGYINDMVAGAKVTGCQWTSTTVNMDLKPSADSVRFELLLSGTVRSNAKGKTHVATVFTNGRHCFNARKTIEFDGNQFEHWRAAVGAGGGSCPYAAETCLSWAPLLGGASERFVIKAANDKAPETNAYSLNKIRREVGTQFDRETGKMLSEAELSLEDKVAGPLRQEGYYPDMKHLQSTETDMQVRTRTMESGELGGSEPPPLPIYPAHGILLQAHASLFNQIGDRLELDGQRFTPEQLKEHMRQKLEAITGKPVDFSDSLEPGKADPDSPKVEEIIFHDADAARFQVRGGEVVLILSVGLKVEGRDEIPPQRISVPLGFALEGDRVVMRRGTVGVSPIGPVPRRERGQQIARAGVMRSKIQQAFEPRDFDSVFNVKAGEKEVTLKVTDLRARGGWLSAIATDGVTETPEPVAQPMQQAAGNTSAATR